MCDMHTHYVLVHARWHGAWCWAPVAERLRRTGHPVDTPDRAEFERIRELVEAQPEPVILVGHSSAGMIISALAELIPERIRLLCYVSAFLLPNGMLPPDIYREDRESILARHIVVDEERQTVTVARPEEVFFHDCDPAEAAHAAGRLVPEPVVPPAGPAVTLTEDNFGRIPKVYVACDADRALGPLAQRRMYTMTPVRHVYHVPSGHSPFLSMPDRLADDQLDANQD
jgi:pimeloyl-ACP methyl ester carboxylesterase